MEMAVTAPVNWGHSCLPKVPHQGFVVTFPKTYLFANNRIAHDLTELPHCPLCWYILIVAWNVSVSVAGIVPGSPLSSVPTKSNPDAEKRFSLTSAFGLFVQTIII